MKQTSYTSEQGFIMVWALLLLVVVSLLGAAAITTSIFEDNMAANEALHKQAFYHADGATEVSLALIVENMNCPTAGFDTTVNDPPILANNSDTDKGLDLIFVGDTKFWANNQENREIGLPTDPCGGVEGPGDEDCEGRDFYYPASAGPDEPHTNVRVNGRTRLMTGANLPISAGYEGKAKALGQGGAYLEYDIKTAHEGKRNSRSGIHTKFRFDPQYPDTNNFGNCIY